ncbi:protein of unknown function [Pararobbsia alpina]
MISVPNPTRDNDAYRIEEFHRCQYIQYWRRDDSHKVAFLHDYGLHEFTVLVRKDP